MTKFSTLPSLGSEVVLGGRKVFLPTAEKLRTEFRAEVQPFYPWYQLYATTAPDSR